MDVLIHPAYLPNIASFAAISQKKILWEVHDNYQKQTYRNRSYICTDQGRFMLSIPIIHKGKEQGRQLYKDVELENTSRWQRQHWRTLQTAYRSSPFFEYYEDEIEPLFSKKFKFLLDFNFAAIDVLASCLQIEIDGSKTKYFHVSAQELIDARFLVNAKKQQAMEQESYMQVFHEKHGFIPNCSVIDLLFNEGTAAADYLKNIKLNFLHA